MVSALLAFMSVTGLAGMYNIKKLDPYLLPPKEIFAGTPAPFRLSVRNRKRYLPSFLITLKCHSGDSLIFPIIYRDSSSEGAVMLIFDHRGIVPAVSISISSSYPVGFFTRYWTFKINDSFTIFPALIPGGYSDSCKESPRIGTAFSKERGVDGELEQIYRYSGLEPLRAIHWKLSARSQELLVKGFGSQLTTPHIINLAELPGQGLEERISCAAWLVRRLVNEIPVGLILGSKEIPPECGSQHALKLLTELALYDSD